MGGAAPFVLGFYAVQRQRQLPANHLVWRCLRLAQRRISSVVTVSVQL